MSNNPFIRPGAGQLPPTPNLKQFIPPTPHHTAEHAAVHRPRLLPSEAPSTSGRGPAIARLPIHAHRTELLYLIEHHSTVILVGETGSGKTTQLPQFLHQAGWTADGRNVVCTQPRRVAAMTISARVASEMGEPVGQTVGYSVRFDAKITEGITRIRYVTDGALLREMAVDPLLHRYSVVMVDEVHERSAATDLLLGLLWRLQRRRPTLRVVIASATMEAERIAEFMRQPWGVGRAPPGWHAGAHQGAATTTPSPAERQPLQPPPPAISSSWVLSGAPALISVQGRQHHVQVHYLEESPTNYVDAALATALRLHEQKAPPGDVLIFFTGQEECEEAVTYLEQTHITRSGSNTAGSMAMEALPLYAGLPAAALRRVWTRPARGVRRMICATNIAETSITLPGVVYVIDTCFVKRRRYDPLTGLESLAVGPVAKASAVQRAGRAGRVQPGHVFRLCTEQDYLTLCPDTEIPEIQRCDMAGPFLQLLRLSISSLVAFPWLSAPPAEAAVRALELLSALGAVETRSNDAVTKGATRAKVVLTPRLGQTLAALPAPPMAAASLVWAASRGWATHVATMVATLMVPTLWSSSPPSSASTLGGLHPQDVHKQPFWVVEGDVITNLNAVIAWEQTGRRQNWAQRHGLIHKALWRVSDIRDQLLVHVRRLLGDVKHDVPPSEPHARDLARAMAAGYFLHAAVLQEEGEGLGPGETSTSSGPGYRLVRSRVGHTVGGRAPLVRLHKGCVLRRAPPRWLVFASAAEVVPGVFEAQGVTAIESGWLTELAPHVFEVHSGGVEGEDHAPASRTAWSARRR